MLSAPSITAIGLGLPPALNIDKTLQPTIPDSGEVWQSTVEVGDPDSDPGDWSLLEGGLTWSDSGGFWSANTTVNQTDVYVIGRYSLGGVNSPWSAISAAP